MKGIIIAGGFGTRLRPLTYDRPKHLLPVANRPFLEYQVAILKRHGIRDIIFATNYHADQIEAHFGDGSRFGVRMRYALEGEPLGTAGAIRNAASLADGDSVLVFNGDILTDFDLTEIIEFHRAREAEATIALRAVERPHPFGIVLAEPDGRVRAWHEPSQEEKKRASENPGPPTGEMDFINAGIYVIEPHVVAGIPAGRSVSIERETYPALLEAGAHIYGCGPLGFWLDMGRPDQYLAANSAVLTGVVQTDVPYRRIAETAQIADDSVLDAATAVGAGSRIGPASKLAECIILDGVQVGARTDLARLIADSGARIADEVTSHGGAVLAAGTVIGRGSRL